MEIMSDPVICASGHTYERTNIKRWLTTNNTSPRTGVQLRNSRLITNYALRDSIQEWLRAKVEADILEDILEATRCEREVATIIEQLALRQELADTKNRLEQENEDDETRYNQEVASLSQKVAFTNKRLELEKIKARGHMNLAAAVQMGLGQEFADNKARLELELEDVKTRCKQEVASLSQELADAKTRFEGEKTEAEARLTVAAGRKMRLERVTYLLMATNAAGGVIVFWTVMMHWNEGRTLPDAWFMLSIIFFGSCRVYLQLSPVFMSCLHFPAT
jgi:hypothetical protein